MFKTMPVLTLRKTKRGHCEKCGGEIKHRPEVETNWYQCVDCGTWQERLGSIKRLPVQRASASRIRP